jgi:hypothetical protein
MPSLISLMILIMKAVEKWGLGGKRVRESNGRG